MNDSTRNDLGGQVDAHNVLQARDIRELHVHSAMPSSGPRQRSGPLVFDNAVDPDEVERRLPVTGPARIIITSTYRVFEELGTPIDVGVFSSADERERVLGPDHPATLESRAELAGAHNALGHADEAIALHRRNLGDRERVLGTDRPSTLTTVNDLCLRLFDGRPARGGDDAARA